MSCATICVRRGTGEAGICTVYFYVHQDTLQGFHKINTNGFCCVGRWELDRLCTRTRRRIPVFLFACDVNRHRFEKLKPVSVSFCPLIHVLPERRDPASTHSSVTSALSSRPGNNTGGPWRFVE